MTRPGRDPGGRAFQGLGTGYSSTAWKRTSCGRVVAKQQLQTDYAFDNVSYRAHCEDCHHMAIKLPYICNYVDIPIGRTPTQYIRGRSRLVLGRSGMRLLMQRYRKSSGSSSWCFSRIQARTSSRSLVARSRISLASLSEMKPALS